MLRMADELVLSLPEARRLAVRCQHLAGPPPAEGIEGVRQVLRALRCLQIDPVNVVARSLLVLWSRLGAFERDHLDTLLWGFAYRNEMYVPKHKRQFGCYVMPVLSGDPLIGRVASRVDRRKRVLDVEGVFAEGVFAEAAGARADPLLPAALESLASFAGADSVRYSGAVALGVS